jgi:hypothetical protein
VIACLAGCGRVDFDPPGEPSYRQAVLAAGPAAYWRLDDPPGSATAADEIGGPSGPVTGAVTFGVPGAIASEPDACATFAEGQWISFGDRFGFAAGETFSLEVWVRNDDFDVLRPFLAKGDYIGFTGGYMLSANISFGVPSLYFEHYTATARTGNWLPMPTGEWTYVVMEVDGGLVYFYVDGTLAIVEPTSQWDASAAEFTLSGPNDGAHGGDSFLGSLDEAAVYTYAVDADVIREHYRIGITP